LMQFDTGMSINRYLPATGTAGFERGSVNGYSRVPAPPPRITEITLSMSGLLGGPTNIVRLHAEARSPSWTGAFSQRLPVPEPGLHAHFPGTSLVPPGNHEPVVRYTHRNASPPPPASPITRRSPLVVPSAHE